MSLQRRRDIGLPWTPTAGSSSRQREEDLSHTQKYRTGMPRVEKYQLGISGISTVVPGVTTINDAWIEIPGGTSGRVTELPAGAKFYVVVNFSATNAAQGLLGQWQVCATVIDDYGSPIIKNYGTINSDIIPPVNNIARSAFRLADMGDNIMPARALNLRIKLWGADGWTPKPSVPPIELW